MILTSGSTSITLNDDLRWLDQQWSGIVEERNYGLADGSNPAPVISHRNSRAGRPMSLSSTSDLFGCIQYSVFSALVALAATNPSSMSLVAYGSTFAVAFRYDEQPVSGEPVLGVTRYAGDEWWTVKINLIQV